MSTTRVVLAASACLLALSTTPASAYDPRLGAWAGKCAQSGGLAPGCGSLPSGRGNQYPQQQLELQRLQREQEAEREAEERRKQEADDADRAGMESLARGNAAAAVAQLTAALQLAPDSAEIRAHLNQANAALADAVSATNIATLRQEIQNGLAAADIAALRQKTQEAMATQELTALYKNLLAISKAPTDLSRDPNAARMSAAELRIVDGHVAVLEKSIALLGESNPEWSRERDRVFEDEHEDIEGATVEGVNFLSFGVAEWIKRGTASHLSSAQIDYLFKAFQEPLERLPADETRLMRVVSTANDPVLENAAREYVAALHRLRDAEHTHDVALMGARLRDSLDTLNTEFEILGKRPRADHALSDGLYASSAAIGSVAIVFVEGAPAEAAALAGSVGSSVLIGGTEMIRIWQERNQLAALDRDASRRNQLRMELTGRLNNLRDERERLVMAAQRAGGNAR